MGMYDTINIICPACGSSLEAQSKAGDCLLRDFGTEDLPPAIAEDLNGEYFYCECGKKLVLELRYPIPMVKLEVKVSE